MMNSFGSKNCCGIMFKVRLIVECIVFIVLVVEVKVFVNIKIIIIMIILGCFVLEVNYFIFWLSDFLWLNNSVKVDVMIVVIKIGNL